MAFLGCMQRSSNGNLFSKMFKHSVRKNVLKICGGKAEFLKQFVSSNGRTIFETKYLLFLTCFYVLDLQNFPEQIIEMKKHTEIN